MINDARNPIWVNEEKTIINCDVEHINFGWIPFTASPNDPEDHGRELFERLKAGEFGLIADYVPPAVEETPTAAPA